MATRSPCHPGAIFGSCAKAAKIPGGGRGVHLATKGHFKIGSETFPKAIVLWADTAPRIVILEVHANDGVCQVKNVWDTGDGTMHSWHNGAAMIIEETEFGRRYRCNDGNPNDDFDDIIFRLESNAEAVE
ncbi:hypothetical protein [Sphingomonas sp.]|uniref:hypothetical protein n=1 Tax=Sphingomonas sp. TaxID=28214 RepID=UPI003D6C9E32